MWFKFITSRARKRAPVAEPQPEIRDNRLEYASLTTSLHSLLETLPHSYSGRESIKLLCHAILSATPHLRFIWVGFSENAKDPVAPYTTAGECLHECKDWRLPARCFDAAGAYSLALSGQSERVGGMPPLFEPWAANPEGGRSASVSSALAIPLRSEKRSMRGLIVFYADSKDYFSWVGVPAFQAFCHLAEIVWKQSSIKHILATKTQSDPLTGLMNRRHALVVMEDDIAIARHEGKKISVLLCRLEDFNKLNDLYGWIAADNILEAYAREIGRQMRPQDKGGRWTGVEFLFVLPDTDADEAEAMGARLRGYFLTNPVNVRNWSIRLALSVGTATYLDSMMGLDDFIQHAYQDMLLAAEEMPSAHL